MTYLMEQWNQKRMRWDKNSDMMCVEIMSQSRWFYAKTDFFGELGLSIFQSPINHEYMYNNFLIQPYS